jgi:hypothetical protein
VKLRLDGGSSLVQSGGEIMNGGGHGRVHGTASLKLTIAAMDAL